MQTIYTKFSQKIKNNPFPTIVIVAFVLLTVLGISGSSMGAFDTMVEGKAPGVLLGQPRPVRSDEWMWQTQDTFVQQASNYPEVNKKIGLGENVSMILDVPFRSFFALFKPQNLFFFVLPFSLAFAAKWWFMSLVLVLGFYTLFDTLFPQKRWLVSLGALLLLFNPFTQWWYQSITLLAIGFALWASFCMVKLFSGKPSTKALVLYGSSLAYSTLCFIFLLYPPFQLSVIYVALALLLGYFYHRYRVQKTSFKDDLPRWLAVVGAGAIILLVMGSFYLTHKDIFHAINNTVYPGVRNFQSGQNASSPDGANFNLLTILSAPILGNLQLTSKAIHFYTNQSEAARIVAINLVLLPVVLFQILKKPVGSRKLADYLLLSTGFLTAIFLIRLCTPLFNLPFKILLFNQVQNERLAIGVALLCAVQLVLIGLTISDRLSTKKAAVVALLAFAFFYDGSHIMLHRYPGFISSFMALGACMVVALCVFLMLRKKTYLAGLALFVVFSIGSSAFVNPLYHRSKPDSLQAISSQISHNYRDDKNWIVVGSVTFENVPLVAGQKALSGLHAYPQMALWQTLDPDHKEAHAYNRFAHVVFTTEALPNDATFNSPQGDLLNIKFSCDVAQKLPNLGYVLSSEQINLEQYPCLHEDRVIPFPKATLRVYKYMP